jgi:hypothetical protein
MEYWWLPFKKVRERNYGETEKERKGRSKQKQKKVKKKGFVDFKEIILMAKWCVVVSVW